MDHANVASCHMSWLTIGEIMSRGECAADMKARKFAARQERKCLRGFARPPQEEL